jgi:hypothetical protein
MGFLGALLGAAVGAVIGSVLWVVVVFTTGYEVGWIAIAVGALAGFGTKVGGRGLNSALGGVIAGAFALGSIALAKVVMAALLANAGAQAGSHDRDTWVMANLQQLAMYETDDPAAAIDLATQRFDELSAEDLRTFRGYPPAMGPDRAKAVLADQLVDNAQQAGIELEWPDGHSTGTAWLRQHYPKSIWDDVEKRWPALPASTRQQYVDYADSEVRQHVSQFYNLPDNDDPADAAASVVGLYDLLWIALALGAAWKLGSATDE